jgi:hypothetical protein
LVLGHFRCRVCQVRTRRQSGLFYWCWWLFKGQGHWSARLHHVRDVLDHRVPQEHDPCHHFGSLWFVVLLLAQPPQEHHPRRCQTLFDLQFWKYQSGKLGRCNHQHAQTSIQQEANSGNIAADIALCVLQCLIGILDWAVQFINVSEINTRGAIAQKFQTAYETTEIRLQLYCAIRQGLCPRRQGHLDVSNASIRMMGPANMIN